MNERAELFQYTPITSAAIYKTPSRFSAFSGEQSYPPSDSNENIMGEFVPKFETLSARNRKIRELHGPDIMTNFVDGKQIKFSQEDEKEQGSANPSYSTVGRKSKSPLIPSTMQWSCSPSVKPSCSVPDNVAPANTRRCKSELTSHSRPNIIEPGDHRKQPLGLLPATMPWVTPIASNVRNPIFIADHRRKKGITEEQSPSSGSLFLDGVMRKDNVFSSPITYEQHRFETSNFRMSGIKPDGNEEGRVRKLLSEGGLHVVKAKADVDILSNRGSGIVHVTLRHDDSSSGGCSVREKLEQIASANGFSVMKKSV